MKSAADDSTSRRTARTRSERLLRCALPAANSVRTGSTSTNVTSRPSIRRASAKPAPPTPAPRSTARSPDFAEVAAASRMASWPTRWPRSGCRSTSRPPRTASSLAVSSGIGAKLVAVTGFDEQISRGGDFVLADQDAPLESADRAFQHADVLIGDQMRDVGAFEQRLDRRDQHGIIGTDKLAQSFSS